MNIEKKTRRLESRNKKWRKKDRATRKKIKNIEELLSKNIFFYIAINVIRCIFAIIAFGLFLFVIYWLFGTFILLAFLIMLGVACAVERLDSCGSSPGYDPRNSAHSRGDDWNIL